MGHFFQDLLIWLLVQIYLETKMRICHRARIDLWFSDFSCDSRKPSMRRVLACYVWRCIVTHKNRGLPPCHSLWFWANVSRFHNWLTVWHVLLALSVASWGTAVLRSHGIRLVFVKAIRMVFKLRESVFSSQEVHFCFRLHSSIKVLIFNRAFVVYEVVILENFPVSHIDLRNLLAVNPA